MNDTIIDHDRKYKINDPFIQFMDTPQFKRGDIDETLVGLHKLLKAL